jgi:hypothetical protein
MDKVFTSIHHVKKSIYNMVLNGEHLFIKYSPSIHPVHHLIVFYSLGEQ